MAQMKPSLSIICPTYNEESRLPLLLADVNLWPSEIDLNVVDGGSQDNTQLIAELFGARISKTDEPNRGKQLNQGALNSCGEWLLFLHSDSRLCSNWSSRLIEIINKESSINYAWFFDFKIKDRRLDLSLLEIAVHFRSVFMQRPYGDQGLLITKNLYKKVGGYLNLHIMEDLDLIIRLSNKTKLKRIGLPLYTDSKKWKRISALKQSIKNANLRARWLKGESPRKLAEEYYGNRRKG